MTSFLRTISVIDRRSLTCIQKRALDLAEAKMLHVQRTNTNTSMVCTMTHKMGNSDEKKC